MSFLYPLYALGIAAIAGPIIVHLIRRMTRRQVPFSTLMFLDPTPPRIDRKSKLEHLPLLLLRCLALALLALAFTRPFMRDSAIAAPGSRNVDRVVLLLDTSASMRRADLAPQMKEKARRIIESLGPVDELAVMSFDRRSRMLVSFEQWRAAGADARKAEALAAVDAASPTWADTDLAAALTAAAEAMEDASTGDSTAAKSAGKRIVLISDLQQGAAVDALSGYLWAGGVRVELATVKAAGGNAGLAGLGDATDSLLADEQPRVRIVNAADSKTENFKLRWSGDPSTESPVYLAAGRSRIARAPAVKAGADRGVLQLIGDAFDFDNTLHIPPPTPAPIDLLYIGTDKSGDVNAPLYYLERALQQTRTQSPRVTLRPPQSAPDAEQLKHFRLIVVSSPLIGTTENTEAAGKKENAKEDQKNNSSVISVSSVVKNLKTAIHAGQTIWYLLRTPEQAADLAELAGVPKLDCQEASFKGYVMLSQVDRQHPLLGPFAESRYGDFTAIHFWKYRRLKPTDLPGARVAASFDSGDPAMLTLPVGKGRLVIFTSGWHPADSKLALSTKFVPLVWSVLEQAGVSIQQSAGVAIGRPLTLPTVDARAILRPDGRRIELQPGSRTYDQTDEPGIYTVITAADQKTAFAANLAASESQTAPMDPEKLEQLGVPLKPPEIANNPLNDEHRRREMAASELEEKQKFWRWAIVAAMIVLLGESLLAGRYSRSAPGSVGGVP